MFRLRRPKTSFLEVSDQNKFSNFQIFQTPENKGVFAKGVYFSVFLKDLQNRFKKTNRFAVRKSIKKTTKIGKKTKNPENPCYFKRILQISKIDKKTNFLDKKKLNRFAV